jgi:hypothetical protein
MTNFDELAAADLPALTTWLESNDAQVSQLDQQRWLAMVELTTAKLTSAASDLERHDWQRLSNAYFRCLTLAKESGVLDETEAVIRSLNLTSALLSELDPQESVGILNPDKGVASFFQYVPVSLVEAHELSENWRAIGVADIRRLRVAKNLLTPILSLKAFVKDRQIRAALEDWEAAFPKLP